MYMPVNCSLIISTYNWPGALEVCLLSVLNQSIFPDEVIIADDGSTEETRAIIQRFQTTFPVPLHHVWHADTGFQKTIILNKAVHKSSFDYVIQVDGDVVLHSQFISDHLYVREDNCFIRGTRAMLDAAKTAEIINSRDIHISALSRGVRHKFNGVYCPLLSPLVTRKERLSRSVRGSNLAFWKLDFVRINGYNNLINGWGHEDEELATRLVNLGIIKKIVKFRSVQYHLDHSGTHRRTADDHRAIIDYIKINNVTACQNGYFQVDNE